MKRKDDVFRYVELIFSTFGWCVVILSGMNMVLGEVASEHSTIFALAGKGLTLETLLQFFLMSVLVTTLRFILFTDGLICRISLTVRTGVMFFLVILMVALFALWFGWFPVNMLEAWVAFLACFAICAFVSAYVMAWKTDRENKEMEEALKRLKEEDEKQEE